MTHQRDADLHMRVARLTKAATGCRVFRDAKRRMEGQNGDRPIEDWGNARFAMRADRLKAGRAGAVQ